MFCVCFRHAADAAAAAADDDDDNDDHGVRRANTARAHTRWQHLVASHEASDTLHRAMCLAPYLPSGIVVAIAIESITS